MSPYLRELDASLQEGAVGSIMGADVAVLAPVAGEGAIHAGQAAVEREKQSALGQRRGRVHQGTSQDGSVGPHPQVILYL